MSNLDSAEAEFDRDSNILIVLKRKQSYLNVYPDNCLQQEDLLDLIEEVEELFEEVLVLHLEIHTSQA